MSYGSAVRASLGVAAGGALADWSVLVFLYLLMVPVDGCRIGVTKGDRLIEIILVPTL
jgi:hypothetical protein